MPFPFPFSMIGSGSTSATGLQWRNSATNSGNASTYTFSACAIGTAAATRYVIVGYVVRGTSETPSSIVIGGVTATEIDDTADTDAVFYFGLVIANVPTGTTADIVLNFAAGQQAAIVGWWTVNMASNTPTFSYNENSINGVQTFSLEIPANSFTCIIGWGDFGAADTVTFDQGFVEDTEAFIDGTNAFFSHKITTGSSFNDIVTMTTTFSDKVRLIAVVWPFP